MESEAPRRLQSLLAERFALKAHRETRDRPIYALVLARANGSLGPRLRQSQVDPEKVQERTRSVRENPARSPGVRINPGRHLRICGSDDGGVGETYLPMYAGRMVVDRTGLTGGFDLALRFDNRPIPGVGPGGGFPLPGADPRLQILMPCRSSPHWRNSSG